MQRIHFRYPAEFATQLSVHVNSLNRALKEITGKTTSQLIAERITQEARGLLKHTDWNISEISWCLGFEEPPHFINFFKKNEHLTPKSFRRTKDI
ncbi:helix-turn-helix domain-containing protein [Chitinophaga pinensis]|uniref:helix-turn-helix domain-containing protein n=1 Tax=Chitinophaga pinensis TaxID=79329 RepID=UPI0021BD4D73|nr:helix-turn-helix transcriptional regulator [Chitinophaga pinensis]